MASTEKIERIESRIKREEVKLESYLQRKQELEAQIQEVKRKIEDYKAEAQYEKMSRTSSVAAEYDITPEDMEQAMRTGDFSIIQAKRQKALEAKAALETTAVSESTTSYSEGAGEYNAEKSE